MPGNRSAAGADRRLDEAVLGEEQDRAVIWVGADVEIEGHPAPTIRQTRQLWQPLVRSGLVELSPSESA